MKVITDDPDHRQIPLTITGRVFDIYTLTPKSVRLSGVVGETLHETVRLVPNPDYAFTVQEVTAKEGKDIRFHLEKIKGGPDPGYELTVENTATQPGLYFDSLYLKTDSKIKPEIEISVIGNIRQAPDKAEKKKNG